MHRAPGRRHLALRRLRLERRRPRGVLAPAAGQRGAFDFGGGRSHAIPAVSDCKVCHESRRTPVLGFSLLQLSPDRDPGAPHAEPPPAPGVDLA